jgi:hypothetical protein
MPYEKIKNIQELKIELLHIAATDECRNTRLFALALTYLLSEICGTDRTTSHVVERAWGNDEKEKVKKNGKPKNL